jgi:oligoribonuclease
VKGNEKNLFWVDIETTGLNYESDKILEIASVVTDAQLNIVAEGPNMIIHHEEKVFKDLLDTVRGMHEKSGLISESRKSKIALEEAEEATLQFAQENCGFKTSPFCGSTVGFDKEFIRKHMPRLFRYLHYRTIDVSSVRELAKRWYPFLEEFKHKSGMHRAKDDIRESIEELKYYQSRIFRTQEQVLDFSE